MKALRLYRDLPFAVRFHTRLRAWTCPISAVADRAPRTGRLLEVGCGHGLFANEAALRSPDLSVLGIDPAPEKIRWAEATVGARTNVRFQCEAVRDVVEERFDSVALLDVLYLVPRTDWPGFLRACLHRLRPGGRLLLKEVDVRPRWKFYRCVLQETVSVRLLGITLGRSLAFVGRDEMATIIGEAGFGDVRATDLARGYVTPHVLYEAVRA